MKKHLLGLSALFFLSGYITAQLPASTIPANKKTIIEDYTGIYCGYCPDGHKIATQIKTADPANVVLLNVHSGPLAIPGINKPDYQTPEGNLMQGASGFNVQQFPLALINRAQYSGQYVLSRNLWAAATNSVKSQPAYCNVACQGTLDVQTRVLSVQAQVYYTASAPTQTNYITIMLVEDDQRAYQSDYGPGAGYNPTNWYNDYGGKVYRHNHLLRKTLTATFGNMITTTTNGTTYNSAIINYTVPATYGAGTNTNTCYLGNLSLIAMVAETNYDVINVCNGPIFKINQVNATDVAPSVKADYNVCAGNLNFSYKFFNYGNAPVTSAVFSYSANGGAPTNYTFTGNVPSYAYSPPMLISNFTTTPMATNTLNLKVISVNGGADQNAANDISNTNIPIAPIAASTSFTMDFYQDRYGSLTYWVIYDEVTGLPVVTDGPWGDLSFNGTTLRQKTFSMTNQNTCYKLIVFDQNGDGISGDYGNGSYSLKSGSNTLFSFNGYFTYQNYGWFETSATLGTQATALSIDRSAIYPNPATNGVEIAIDLNQNETIEVTAMNALGQMIHSQNLQLESGINKIKLSSENWPAGFYNVNLITPGGSVNHKLIISK